jgi:NAD(P)-dependent dehydrogenase (short-subunit alcohol dehydrogenase family)
MAGTRAVLVTGASKGIGEACALRLARDGWLVWAGVRADADADRLRQAHPRISPVRLDVTSAGDILAVSRTIESAGQPLHGLVNNAGIAVAGPLEFLPLAELRNQLEINVVGQMAVTQAVLPALRRTRGRIVFVSSISGLSALPFTGAYAASKFALEAIADALRMELLPFGLQVSVIEPGVIATPIWETSRLAAERYLDSAAPEMERFYGEALEAIRRRAATGMGGLPAAVVARAVEHALTARRPRTRYLIGKDARARLLMQRLLPDRWRDALVRRALSRL